MSRRRMFVGSLALALVLTTDAWAGGDPQGFVTKAGTAGLYEVRAAEVAREKTRSEEVREFADEMIKDHEQANQELRELATERRWRPPAALDTKHQGLLDRLQQLDGSEFDAEYAKQQLQAHQEAVTLFEEQAEQGTDPQLKSWAGEKLDTLQTHLEHAKQLGSVNRRSGLPDRSLDRSTPTQSTNPGPSAVPDGGVQR
jgi:putative membrane protein